MNIIHNSELAKAVELIERELRLADEQRVNNPAFGALGSIVSDLGAVIDMITDADKMWAELLADPIDNPCEVLGQGGWDGQAWRKAIDGDYLMLRDPAARAEGPVYLIDGVPAWRADDTMSVHARLYAIGSNRIPTGWDVGAGNWPQGPSLMEFSPACWQVWHDFELQP